jgi:hypothetical protein
MVRRPYFFLMLALFAATALWAAAQPSADETEQQRVRLEAIRKHHPDQLERLRNNVNAFLNLNAKKKDAVVKLDQEMHELPPARQARYWKTLERYVDWLDQLKKKDPAAYQAINTAPDAATRLALVKERRDREWMESQPKAHREKWAKLQGDERAKYVASLRAAERKKHEHWVVAQRFAKELETAKALPCRLNDFGVRVKNKDGTFAVNKDGSFKENNKVRDYVTDYLLRYLSKEEKEQLDNAEGIWPDYPQALVAVASKHPSALPPSRPEDFPIGPDKLPKEIKARITEKKGGGVKGKKKDELKPFEGRPEYGTHAVEVGTNRGNLPFDFEFWACNFNSLQAPMKEFVKDQLKPKLDTKDQADLVSYEGKWPYYPQTIQELARKHGLRPPWHILPEQDKWHWDRYRPERYQAPVLEKGKENED